MKVWITKYALSKGILVEEVELTTHEMVSVVKTEPKDYGPTVYFHGKGRDWHETYEDAKTKAETMRTKKIASLERQISRLKRLLF